MENTPLYFGSETQEIKWTNLCIHQASYLVWLYCRYWIRLFAFQVSITCIHSVCNIWNFQNLKSNSYISLLFDWVMKTLKNAKGPVAWYTPLLWQKWIMLKMSDPLDILSFFCRQFICVNSIDHFDYSTYHINIYFSISMSC